MDVKVKQRLIGALVLGALAIIFVPMIVIGPEREGAADAADLPIAVPEAPDGEFVTREIPLGAPVAAAPAAGGVIVANPDDPNALATVDAAATTAPRVDALDVATPAAVDAATGLPSAPIAADTPLADAPTPVPAPAVAEPPAPVAVTTPAPTPVATPSRAPTPPPAPAAVAAGDFTVTAGTFGQRSNADALVARLKSSGLPAFTEAALANGQPATRVKVGPFADRAAAEAARVRTAAISGSAAVTTGDAPAAASRPSPAPAAPTTSAAAPAASGSVPPAASSGFAVQLGAFANQSDAQALVSRARAAGFSAFEQRTPTANGVLWRVRLGPVADRAAAEAMKSDAASRVGIAGNVVTHP